MNPSRLISTAIILLACVASADAAKRNQVGEWTTPYKIQIAPSGGALLPDGRVLLWSANYPYAFNDSAPRVYTVVYNPVTNSHIQKLDSIPHNMFCTGTTQLADGRLLANGGNQTTATSVYSAATLKWNSGEKMNIGRGYNANTILQDGTVLTIGGSWRGAVGGKVGEVWTSGSGWKSRSGLPTTQMETKDNSNVWAFDSHFWLLPTGNGKVFQAGPSSQMHWIDPRGNGSVTRIGPRGDDSYAITGAAVMFEMGQILKAGGSSVYKNNSSSRNAYVINVKGGVSVRKVSPMIYQRGYVNSAVLPDGKVLIVGGQTYMKEFSDANAVLAAELFDPKTSMFSLMAPMSVARNYHAIALLLPDARVMSAGGGLCGSCSANHTDFQIFSPPYLFDSNGNPAKRPVITSAPATAEYGRSIIVKTDGPVSSFSMVRFSAVTHSINNDQRRLAVPMKSIGTNTYQIDIFSNPGWLLPGNWLLFAMNSSGTPSVAKVVQVKLNRTADIVSPGEISGKLNSALSIPVTWKSLGPSLTFSSYGLPSGLYVDSKSGRILGTPKATGTFNPYIKANGPEQAVSTEFVIKISP